MLAALVWVFVGLVVGAVGYRTAVVRAPGRPVQP